MVRCNSAMGRCTTRRVTASMSRVTSSTVGKANRIATSRPPVRACSTLAIDTEATTASDWPSRSRGTATATRLASAFTCCAFDVIASRASSSDPSRSSDDVLART